jgi:hypothetical protein
MSANVLLEAVSFSNTQTIEGKTKISEQACSTNGKNHRKRIKKELLCPIYFVAFSALTLK